jgi:hypothetical protein
MNEFKKPTYVLTTSRMGIQHRNWPPAHCTLYPHHGSVNKLLCIPVITSTLRNHSSWTASPLMTKAFSTHPTTKLHIPGDMNIQKHLKSLRTVMNFVPGGRFKVPQEKLLCQVWWLCFTEVSAASLSPRRLWFDQRALHVGFVLD